MLLDLNKEECNGIKGSSNESLSSVESTLLGRGARERRRRIMHLNSE